MTHNIEVVLVKHRASIIKHIIDLAGAGATMHEAAKYREQARKLFDDLETVNRTLAGVADKGDERFSNFIGAIDAIVAFLQERRSPAPKEEIIQGVLNGGFRGGHKGRNATHVGFGISTNLKGTGEGKYIKRAKNGLIGLVEWDDSVFE